MENEQSKVLPPSRDGILQVDTVISLIAVIVFISMTLSVCIKFSQSYFEDCDENKDAWNKQQCLQRNAADDRASWGQFGDFLGGVINPTFGFLTILLLLAELKATRKASEEARLAQERTEAALRDQLAEAKSQNHFANYFKHLEEFTNHVKPLIHQGVTINFRQLHRLLYPNVRNGSEEISKNVIGNFAQTIY